MHGRFAPCICVRLRSGIGQSSIGLIDTTSVFMFHFCLPMFTGGNTLFLFIMTNDCSYHSSKLVVMFMSCRLLVRPAMRWCIPRFLSASTPDDEQPYVHFSMLISECRICYHWKGPVEVDRTDMILIARSRSLFMNFVFVLPYL